MARMLYRNIGMNRDERIQNTFTRYLTCALDRENARFRYKQRQEQKMQPYDETGDEPASGELLAALADRQVTQASNSRSWQDFLQQVDAGWLYKALHALIGSSPRLRIVKPFLTAILYVWAAPPQACST